MTRAALTCLIYGGDGFDGDVLENLMILYRDLGCAVAASRRLRPADLLVVQRMPNESLDLTRYERVHVYDYVGVDIAEFLRSVGTHPGLRIFTSSKARKAWHETHFPQLAPFTTTMLPPVNVDMWVRRRMFREEYRTVHVGNYKEYYSRGDDVYASRFMEHLRDSRVHVWGAGWDGRALRIAQYGQLGLFRVSDVYSRSRVALGMMYPYQREVTLSGRFWQAPLNGCALLSEFSAYAGVVPGVFATDYTASDLRALIDQLPSRREISHDAEKYWRDHYERVKEVVAHDLSSMGSTRALRPGFAKDVLDTRARAIYRRIRP